jgi:putative FmdB family regulatory protein
MPAYEFQCRSCGQQFERTMHVDEYERAREQQIDCPNCGSKDVVTEVTTFEVQTSRKAS